MICLTEVITVYPNQSVTEVVMKELKERARQSKTGGGAHTTSTIIITAASRVSCLLSLCIYENDYKYLHAC